MLRKAKSMMDSFGVDFVVTGEVLGQRPMSQHRRALDLIEKESGLMGKILRPLSAKLLSKTEPEINGIIDINKFPEISGRGRYKQIELAKLFNIKNFPTPAGGCLLTDEKFSAKLKDLLDNKDNVTLNDIPILKIGRHFRFNNSKIIAARDENEVKKLFSLKNKDDWFFEIKNGKGSTIILQGEKSKDAILLAQKITAFYSKSDSSICEILSNSENETYITDIVKPAENEISIYNLSVKKLR